MYQKSIAKKNNSKLQFSYPEKQAKKSVTKKH